MCPQGVTKCHLYVFNCLALYIFCFVNVILSSALQNFHTFVHKFKHSPNFVTIFVAVTLLYGLTYRVAQKVSHYQVIKNIVLNRIKACP